MMTTYNFIPTLRMSAEYEDDEDYAMYNGTAGSCFTQKRETDVTVMVYMSFTTVVCIFGLLGNGSVIWLLGFRMKRNPFTTYILNLAVADFGVHVFLIILDFIKIDCENHFFHDGVLIILYFMFSTSEFLLTAISIDRCVSVLFPLWYRCHRPNKLSAILCAVIWILCFLVHGICQILRYFSSFLEIEEDIDILFYIFLVNATICLPLITTSTMILFIRFCLKSQQLRRKKLLLAILLTLFFFLFLAFPLNAVLLKLYHSRNINIHSYYVGHLCASVNSFVNPLIYLLVGRKKRDLCKENLRLVLQRVFQPEEEAYREELRVPA
ncbi:hypothetical protein lerEdw1_014481 [Lerista edwardsae]|nr:hypothetical protein lerEdw1_014483 [Lerista edwardsae]KAJ6633564.1 hypothetical protein lerEdw1_014481 [Lerista edwardsae]